MMGKKTFAASIDDDTAKAKGNVDILAEIAATDKKKLDDFVKAIKEHGSPKAKATEVDHLGRPIR